MNGLRLSVILATVLLIVASCEDSSVTNNTSNTGGTLDIGEWSAPTTTSISTGGGKVKITGDPDLDGFQISVPPGSLNRTATFTVRTAPIEGSNLPGGEIVLSPIIEIDNGGGYSEGAMFVTIPIELPENHYAMAWLYDEEGGFIDALVPVGLYNDSIVVGTMSFDQSLPSLYTVKGKGVIQNGGRVGRVVVTAYAVEDLNGPFDSGFTPGTDDFEMQNRGSVVAPAGHCAGQSIAAMWYFLKRKSKNGNKQLYGLLDSLDALRMDNPRGMKLSSAVQNDLKWEDRYSDWNTQFEAEAPMLMTADRLHYYAFCTFIKKKQRPAFVYVSSSAGGAHAMVAYAVGNDRISIADPNWPGSARSISITGDDFDPYDSKDRADDNNKQYETIRFVLVSAVMDIQSVDTRWDEVFNDKIGDDLFPKVTIEYDIEPDNFVKIPDTLTKIRAAVDFRGTCMGCTQSPVPTEAALIIWTEDGNEIGRNVSDPSVPLKISPLALTSPQQLKRTLGIMVLTKHPTKGSYEITDYQWLTLKREALQAMIEVDFIGVDDDDNEVRISFSDTFDAGFWIGDIFTAYDQKDLEGGVVRQLSISLGPNKKPQSVGYVHQIIDKENIHAFLIESPPERNPDPGFEKGFISYGVTGSNVCAYELGPPTYNRVRYDSVACTGSSRFVVHVIEP